MTPTPASLPRLDHHQPGDTDYVRGLADALYIAGHDIDDLARRAVQLVIDAERGLIRRRAEQDQASPR